MDGLIEVVSKLKKAGVKGRILIDGSFVTQKIDPSDVDAVLHCDSTQVNIDDPELMKQIEWLNEDLKSSHGCDTYYFITYPNDHPSFETGRDLKAYWLGLFGYSRGEQAKGIPYVEI